MKPVKLNSVALCTLALAAGAQGVTAKNRAPKKANNVLFIIVDDLRTELSCYGVEGMHTPNIDALAKNGVLFERAYSNIPVSGASRASLMTGMRPTRERFLDVEALIEQDVPGAVTMPLHFKNSGFTTISNSKIIHGHNDAKESWSQIWAPKDGHDSWRNYLGDENIAKAKVKGGPSIYESLDVADNAYYDGMTADKSIEDLRKFKKSGEPFFMAVGILKPHLPFNAPKRYWDLYDREDIEMSPTYEMNRESFPAQAFHQWGELRFYNQIPAKGAIQDEELARTLIHAYKACVSYADAQVGAIVDELKRLGMYDDTLIVLVGDHGWSLGDHSDWCKHSNFAVANHAPMIFSGVNLPKGKRVEKVVEFVDLYPTICSMAGLDVPEQCEGGSMVKLLYGKDKAWKNSAVVKWHAGLSLFTPEYNYTRWQNPQGKMTGEMLFDCNDDVIESRNLVAEPELQSTVESLRQRLDSSKGADF